MSKKILVIGNSHAEALRAARREGRYPEFTILNLRREADDLESNPQARAALAERVGKVDAVCFCLQGNLHNVLGLINNPRPFFMAPSPPHGELVPQDMMRAHIKSKIDPIMEFEKDILSAFSSPKCAVIDPPPPAGDEDHIRQYPGIFADKLELGVSPDALRLQLYDLQSSIFQDLAKSLGADFCPSPKSAHDARGFLARPYWNADPTHANAAYGHLVLESLRALMGDNT